MRRRPSSSPSPSPCCPPPARTPRTCCRPTSWRAAGDPQLAAAESSRLATREGAVQARAALLPQIDGSADLHHSRSTGPSSQTQFDRSPASRCTSAASPTATPRPHYGVNLNQGVFDFGRIHASSAARTRSAAPAISSCESAGDSLVTRTSQAYFNVLVAIETPGRGRSARKPR